MGCRIHRSWSIERLEPSRIVTTVEDAANAEDGSNMVYDYVVVSTKQLPTISPVVEVIRPVVTPGRTAIVLIQNGIGIEKPVIEAFPGNAVISSVSHIGAEVRSLNIAIQSGKDVSKIGPHFHPGLDDTESLRLARLFVEMYRKGGAADVQLTENISIDRWEKLLRNGSFNTVCALMRMNVGELQRSRGRETMLISMMWEIPAIAKAAGHEMPETTVQWMAYRLPDDCDFRPSMLLDLINKRPMELEVILGNALGTAKELNVATPKLTSVYDLLKLEEWRIEQSNKKATVSGKRTE